MRKGKARMAKKNITAKYYPFDEALNADSNWSLSTGPDGRIYTAACSEHNPGFSVTMLRYDEANDRLENLVDVAEAVGDPPSSGRATQCKIHYSFSPSVSDGVLYAATHLSGPPRGERYYSAWNSWYDEAKAFRGAGLMAWGTKQDDVLWTDIFIPREGCRCLCLDEERGVLYAVTYPRDHFVSYDIKRRVLTDHGRLGSVNAQVIFLDRKGRAYTSNDYGRLVRYDPEGKRLEELPHTMPHEHYQSGWHSVLYDAVASPAGDCVYLSTWIARPHLARFWPEEGEHGRLEDLGSLTQERDATLPFDTFLDHAGGLVFGADGLLYYCASRWPARITQSVEDEKGEAYAAVMRLDPDSLEREQVTTLRRDAAPSQYISRGARDRNGDLYFAHVGWQPVGFFKLSMGVKGKDKHLPLRMWG